jgi:hypothetical protein
MKQTALAIDRVFSQAASSAGEGDGADRVSNNAGVSNYLPKRGVEELSESRKA